MAYLMPEICCQPGDTEQFKSLCCQPTKQHLDTWLLDQKIGFKTTSQGFDPCAISLTPWRIKQRSFLHLQNISRAVARTLVAASQDQQFLIDALADYHEENTLLQEFKRYLIRKPVTKAMPLTMSRQDFFLDIQGHWKLVESNAIAAGMGPFSEALQNLQSMYNPALKFATNPATQLQAKALFEAAQQLSQKTPPTIVFLVDPNEDNVFDQAKLAEQLRVLGARVFILDLIQAQARFTSRDSNLILDNQFRVDCIYFRTGYNLADYHQKRQNLTSFRYWFEQHKLVVAPSIAMQVASSKWLQMKLSETSVNRLVDKFGLSHFEATLANQAFNTDHRLIQDASQIKRYLESKHWILKTQNEGGGSIRDTLEYFDEQLKISPALLMKKIHSQLRKEKQVYYAERQLKTYLNTISELGIFNLGENLNYGGYLLRTKPSHQLETGIHQGGGLLDCLVLQ